MRSSASPQRQRAPPAVPGSSGPPAFRAPVRLGGTARENKGIFKFTSGEEACPCPVSVCRLLLRGRQLQGLAPVCRVRYGGLAGHAPGRTAALSFLVLTFIAFYFPQEPPQPPRPPLGPRRRWTERARPFPRARLADWRLCLSSAQSAAGVVAMATADAEWVPWRPTDPGCSSATGRRTRVWRRYWWSRALPSSSRRASPAPSPHGVPP